MTRIVRNDHGRRGKGTDSGQASFQNDAIFRWSRNQTNKLQQSVAVEDAGWREGTRTHFKIIDPKGLFWGWGQKIRVCPGQVCGLGIRILDPHLSRSLVVCDLQMTCDAFWSAQKQHLDRSHFRLKEPRAEKNNISILQ